MNIKERIKKYFSDRGIEYYGVLDFSECRLTKKHLIDRTGVEPQSALIYIVPYFVSECDNISAYASSLDYHIFLSDIGTGLVKLLNDGCGADALMFGDHSPIDERDAAAKCALGIIGDNGLLINEKYGSYVFIGEVITNVSPSDLGAKEATRVEFCEHCGRCLAACPKVQIGECLSSLTQKKGSLSERECRAIMLGGSAWGCDICQKVCPHNRNPIETPIAFFHKDRITTLSRESVEHMSDESFKKRAFAWRGRETLLRNLDILEND